jgi:lipopolysaccharide transport system permease protein
VLAKLSDLRGHRLVAGELWQLATRYRYLTLELTKREITERYAGQVFGSLWAVGHPLILMAIYVFVFSYVFRTSFGGTPELPRSYTVFLLSGLVPWLAFQEAIAKSPMVVLSNRNLVKQIVFPIEVLPATAALSTIPTAVVSFAFLAIYSLTTTAVLPWTMLLLPVALAAQAAAMAGVAYALSAIGVYFRDLKDFIAVFLSIAIFVHPIIFVPGTLPGWVEYAFYLSPFSYMIWVYQDICFYGAILHPVAWIAFLAGSALTLYAGYRLFRGLRISFGNAI